MQSRESSYPTPSPNTVTPGYGGQLEEITRSRSSIVIDQELRQRLLSEIHQSSSESLVPEPPPTAARSRATTVTQTITSHCPSRLLQNKPSFSQSLNASTCGSVSLSELAYDLPDAYQVDFNIVGSTLEKRYKYPTNYQRTTKYTIFTFVPLNLFSQFRRFYNIYFLLAAIFVLIAPSLDPVSTVLPLCIVLLITAVKDGVEDYKRYRQDKRVNALPYEVVRSGQRITTKSKHIRAGDIIRLSKGQTIPADMLVLCTSFEDGTAFVETMDLDGETSLKRKSSLRFTQPFVTDTKVGQLRGRIQCEFPNDKLDQFDGRVHFHRASPIMGEKFPEPAPPLLSSDTSIQPFTTDNILLRGTHLRNTDFIYGVVVYAGVDTKIIRNLKNTGLKFSTMETRLNRLIIAIFVWNAIMLVVSVVLSLADATRSNGVYIPHGWYLGHISLDAMAVVEQVMVFFVIYTFLIPISIFVSIELVHILQALFMRWDPRMKSVRLDPKTGNSIGKTHMHVHNTNLHEDLGAVEYIFSDKTGTLTKNIMTLSKWCIGCQVFDEAVERGCLGKYLQTLDQSSPLYQHHLRFIQTVALCHSALPVFDEANEARTLSTLLYESQSPDEVALLNAIRDNGVVFNTRTKRSMAVQRIPLGQETAVDVTESPIGTTTDTAKWWADFDLVEDKYELLYTFPFSSDRKRMSVVVRTPEGIMVLLCKGADSAILPRLSPTLTAPALLTHTENSIHQFSLAGLRTLVMATRTLEPDEFAELHELMEQAQCAISHREERLSEVAEWIETDLELLGCTAIEDRLQDQVPETIEYLLRCGIKIWLLTGDKQETAVKIGMSSHLITGQMNLIILNAAGESECAAKLQEFVQVAESRGEGEENALVVSGSTLGYILESTDLSKSFLQLGVRCHSVICCRVTPLQKARVVQLVKKRLKKVTLSIGDGANDVSMIQVAHVGVGIEGVEGAQAVRASDYSFVEFKSLRPLISIHGRYSYLRIANIIFYSFYKNIALITVQFWFGFNNAWSGHTVYLDFYLTLFNTVFTCLPPIVAACFDKDVDEQQIALYPELFRQVQQHVYWNWKVLVHWGLSSMWHAGVLYGCLVLVQSGAVMYSNGMDMSYLVQEYFIGTLLFVVVTAKACLLLRHWVWPSVAGIGITVVVYVLIQWGFELFNFVDQGTFVAVHSLPALYFTGMLAVVACILPDFVVKYWYHMYQPEDAVVIRERARLARRDSRLEDKEGSSCSQSMTLIAETPTEKTE
ncbi:hypothetical protein IWQ61_003703 [Dispira simplex]|nr:hypothetical protein IWQ61_003703 [Dispira simplex]